MIIDFSTKYAIVLDYSKPSQCCELKQWFFHAYSFPTSKTILMFGFEIALLHPRKEKNK